jgi:lysozyme
MQLGIENRKRLRDILVRDEEYRAHPYEDTTGHLTVGIGRNLTDRGISLEEALLMLDNDVQFFSSFLSARLPFFESLDDVRKIVLICMCFNLGTSGILKFPKMLDAIADKRYHDAADEMMDSTWSGQVKERSFRLSQMMCTGEFG